MNAYRAPWWLPGGHLQTIWPALRARPQGLQAADPVVFRRERWATPDGDFVDVDFAGAPAGRATGWLVLFHGLEGSSASPYAQAFAVAAAQRGWGYAVPHFRGCSGTPNLAPRAYHSGDYVEIGWMLDRLRAQAGMPLHVVGVSLGGNALLRWAQEAGLQAAASVQAVAAVCSPIDLTAAGHAIGRGLNRQIYTRMFLRSMKPKALAQWTRHPGLFDRDRLVAARDLYEFDDVYTAPLHGYAGVDDYWSRASAQPHLAAVRVPALVINSLNDPFVPASSLLPPRAQDRWVTHWRPRQGGHVGFPSGPFPSHLQALPAAVLGWFDQQRAGASLPVVPAVRATGPLQRA